MKNILVKQKQGKQRVLVQEKLWLRAKEMLNDLKTGKRKDSTGKLNTLK